MPTFYRPWRPSEIKLVNNVDGKLHQTLVDEAIPDRDPNLKAIAKSPVEKKTPEKQPKRRPPKSELKQEKHPGCLPFYLHQHYKRLAILKQLAQAPEMRHLIGSGSYYIERDFNSRVDPRTEPKKQQRLLRLERIKHKRTAHYGQQQRIVALFMRKMLDFYPSRELYASARRNKTSWLAMLWLGQNLAKQVYSELMEKTDEKPVFKKKSRTESRVLYIVNRLPHDIFFKDQEVFFHMLRQFVLSPDLCCAQKYENPMADESMEPPCEETAELVGQTRRACVHQNLSMSLKPCLVDECPNFGKSACPHLRCFVPETITICSYASGLRFAERMRQPEDLMGCIFVTKPAYLCHSRGIRFILDTQQFDAFYRTLDGRRTSRHGVVLQRYVECPRLIKGRKFSIRFFLLVIVLSRRRVLGFLHFGVVMMAREPYPQVKRRSFTAKDDTAESIINYNGARTPIEKRTIGRVLTSEFDLNAHLTSYLDPRVRRMLHEGAINGSLNLLNDKQDNCSLIDDSLPSDSRTDGLRSQMAYAAVRIIEYIQPLVQDYRGTFQTFAFDAVPDARNKLWIIGSNTVIFSSMLSMAPRQRRIMSAILQESLGITVECFYKDQRRLPLETKGCGFLFAQDFRLVYDSGPFEVEVKEKRPRREPTVEERYEQIDKQVVEQTRRKELNAERQREAVRRRRAYLARLRRKGEEES